MDKQQGISLWNRCLEVIKDNLPTTSPDMKLGEAVILVSRGRLGICIAIEEGRVIGIVTDGDIRRAMENSQNRFFELTVRDIMTQNPKTVTKDTRIADISHTFFNQKSSITTSPPSSMRYFTRRYLAWSFQGFSTTSLI